MTKSLFIGGAWTDGTGSRRGKVVNPATGEAIGTVAFAEAADLDAALAAAESGFRVWRKATAFERYRILTKAADLMRERAETIAQAITREQGKPLAESRMEAGAAADITDWFAEEGRRAYGRVIPSRLPGARQVVLAEPVGPVAAFSPWNFPCGQLVRKLAAALAAGCSIIAKAPEETPSSAIELVRCFEEAGVPAGALNLVFGVPAEISSYFIPSPVIRKISFTGSVAVGRSLSALAGQHLKRTTMELGGHGPFIVCDDVDVDAVARIGAGIKFRNAGQVCTSPTRFLVDDKLKGRFTEAFTALAEKLVVGNGAADGTQMGPLAHARRVDALDGLIRDAAEKGARVVTGGRRIGNEGYFYAPTVLADVPLSARIMSEEPFGPVAIVNGFGTLDEAVAEANRLPYGLGAYAFAASTAKVAKIGDEVESGMISINHFGFAAPETPFGGIKDSGHGAEGGSEGLQAYLAMKFVSQVAA
ncbi:NAD-dependent succinate-semialdehyde dehydrogenase [Mesorhizobium sp. CU2]|uniref:NAD-dependent succinate-semialdehyde dehydrogenase n=1 Tax=unclassified Mesorhizobium TaxID=325217 RepID=UPI0011281377|nr:MULTISPECIES: NAD-dependent succinate-semialdehyde dehydrogenase [unclassified Mesorhizobium]TPN85606.1 NAD-dependent succinate-semialdehyde dehydrogenase [Mesorhizobium sp. CU3]TPO10284.1 NAD-dependent succinate-semialdehyde dehydrogenase [Mesorhizobium sp. CU2]